MKPAATMDNMDFETDDNEPGAGLEWFDEMQENSESRLMAGRFSGRGDTQAREATTKCRAQQSEPNSYLKLYFEDSLSSSPSEQSQSDSNLKLQFDGSHSASPAKQSERGSNHKLHDSLPDNSTQERNMRLYLGYSTTSLSMVESPEEKLKQKPFTWKRDPRVIFYIGDSPPPIPQMDEQNTSVMRRFSQRARRLLTSIRHRFTRSLCCVPRPPAN